MLIVCTCALCFRISCSSRNSVRLWFTFCRTWHTAVHVFCACSFWQSPHCSPDTTYSTTNDCCRIVAANTSRWIVSFTFSRRECGSVHTNPASTSFTLLRPRSFFRHSVSSRGLSSGASIHAVGGWWYRPHPRHHCTVICFGIPSVMSTWLRRQSMHMFALFGAISVPHMQHRMLFCVAPNAGPPPPITLKSSSSMDIPFLFLKKTQQYSFFLDDFSL